MTEPGKRTASIFKQYLGFLPKGYAFVCPKCRTFKAYPENLGNIRGIRCGDQGVIANEGASNRPDKHCGQFTSEEEVRSFIGMEMVEE